MLSKYKIAEFSIRGSHHSECKIHDIATKSLLIELKYQAFAHQTEYLGDVAIDFNRQKE